MRRSDLRSCPVTWILIVICLVLWVAAEATEGSTSPGVLLMMGAKLGALIWKGQWWRLFSSLFLHAGATHLLLNCYALLWIGPYLEATLGSIRYLFLFLFCGCMGNTLSLVLSPQVSVGSSGAIMGIAGALISHALSRPRQISAQFRRIILFGLLPAVLYNFSYGILLRGVDNFAHLGGFLSGIIAGFLLPARGEVRHQKKKPYLAIFVLLSASAVLTAVAIPNPQFLEQNLLFLGDLQMQKGNIREAIPYYEECLLINPDSEPALANLGSACLQVERTYDGIAAWKRLLTLNPGNRRIRLKASRVLFLLAEATRESGNYEEAIACYKESLRYNPRNDEAHACLGAIYFAIGKYGQGMAHWKESLKINPARKKIEAALSRWQKMVLRAWLLPSKINYGPAGIPVRALKQNREGEKILLNTGDWTAARIRFRTALSPSKRFAAPLNNLGVIELFLGNLKEAEELFYQSISADPSFWEPYVNLGAIRCLGKNSKEAKRLCLKALRLKPTFAPAYLHLASLRMEEGDLAGSGEMLSTAVRLEPDNPHFHAMLAGLYLKQHKESRYFQEMTTAIALARSRGNTPLEEFLLQRLKMHR